MTVLDLQFDEETHTYRYAGHVVRSVTQVLADAGLCDYTYSSEFAMWRGSIVHKAVHVELTNRLDWSTVSESFHPYIMAAKQMVADLGGEVVDVERRVFSSIYGFAGTLDLILRVGDRLVLIDHKTGVPQPWTGLQLAAYAHAYYEETKQLVSDRFACHLKATGEYELKPYTERTDRDRFLAGLTVANLRRQWGLIQQAA